VCVAEETLAHLTTRDFLGAWAEVRVTWTDILELSFEISDPWEIYTAEELEQLRAMLAEYREAYEKKQGRTKAIPICGAGAGRAPAKGAYTKPVLILADEMSASSADMFAAMAQDNHIAPIFGYRTMGAGGSPSSEGAGVYSEGFASVTRTLAVRAWPVSTPDFPTTSYIENVGVRPDIPADYMTVENLLGRGEAFVKAFTAEAVRLARNR
jgi:C-terminal processing protease CtpA/Prc